MVQSRPYKGLFITIEGGEGAGKTTLAGALVSALEKKGHLVYHTREPGGTPLSEEVRTVVLNKTQMKIGARAELLLFLAARVQHLEEIIFPLLHEGKIVLCERFNDSSIAYQGCARHLGMHYVEELCALACGGFVPDSTLFLDLDPEIGFGRMKKRKEGVDRLEQEHLQFHREVRQGFLHLADKFPERIKILDASLPEEQLIEKALECIYPLIVKV